MSKSRPYILHETNYLTVNESQYDLAILPWGATEAHNYHLPYGTDTILATAVAEEAAKIAWDEGAKLVVLPTVPFGVNTGQMDVDLCINMNPSTQLAVLRDIAEVLVNNDIPKLVILNAHGGNSFKPIIRELSVEFEELFICSIDWWKSADASKIFDEPGDHAGELETSAIMHLTPDWVLPLDQAGDGAAKRFKFEAFKAGWASAQREWSSVTRDTGVGDPKNSTAEKGKTFVSLTSSSIGKFLSELSRSNNSELYE